MIQQFWTKVIVQPPTPTGPSDKPDTNTTSRHLFSTPPRSHTHIHTNPGTVNTADWRTWTQKHCQQSAESSEQKTQPVNTLPGTVRRPRAAAWILNPKGSRRNPSGGHDLLQSGLSEKSAARPNPLPHLVETHETRLPCSCSVLPQ